MANIVPLAKATETALTNANNAAASTVQVPHSVAAEQAILGLLMVNNRQLDDLAGAILAEHFYVPLHAAIFEGLQTLVNRGREANPITLREILRGTPYDDEQTLLTHLTQMFENAGLGGDVRSLAEVIHTTYLQRQLITLGESLRSQAGSAHRPDEAKEVLDAVSGELFKLAESGSGSSSAKNLRDPLIEVIKRAEQARKDGGGVSGVSTGFIDIDHLLGGLHKSDLIILAARPSMGKTSFAINVAQNAATRMLTGGANGAAVGVFSLEMSADQLAARMLSSAAGISSHQLTNGHLSDADFRRLSEAAGQLAELPMYIDDTPQLSVNALRARARRMKRLYGIGLLVVDYLQLMSGSKASSADNRVQEVSEISQGLKTIARELNVPVIALSQLSRSVENRDNKRPQLSDLRESGSIEQDADLVVFLYREDYYLSRQLGAEEGMDEKTMKLKEKLEQVRGRAEVLFSKNRKGPTGVVTLMFHGETTTFHNMAPQHYNVGGPDGPPPFDT
ncbi:MAG: replicative DNA helicase [Blastochloris viridis]|uniref:Replicative DNA helicase n=1 Tax=Blastochloris viridis TaxID=1079 RepID=A0A6N4RBC6_BLAVI|nr:MAG: replicative DNA helicase [Blastochloris viridis]